MNTFLIAYFFLCLGGLIGWLVRHAVAREQVANGDNAFANFPSAVRFPMVSDDELQALA